MSELKELAESLGKQLLEKTQANLEKEWETLPAEDKKSIERCAKRFGKLSVDKFAGKNVDRDLAQIKSTLMNLTYVNSSRAVKAFWEAAQEVIGAGLGFVIGIISKGLAV